MSLIEDRTLLVNLLVIQLTLLDIDTTANFLWVALDLFVVGIELLRLLFAIQVGSE
jgi:hypothetical protein